ncbi:MAG TPA: HPF/RaiA family ribosome-associated protein [Methylomirabilota bacterium]|jgi:ribosomal subunit interface protein|nr:HPF/RaiA family ribosome-associated protein [Methylomirabilota bacterium]
MQVEIEGRNTEVRQSWRDLIDQKLKKLEHFPNEITRARVTITHNPHHHLGDNQVQVVLAVAGQTLTVKKKGAQIPAVLRSALTAAEREIETYHQHRFNRKRAVKTPTPYPTGTIARVLRTKGYGYIQTPDGQVYFHRDALDGLTFDDIHKGMSVSFELTKGKNGLEAARVFAASNGR